MHYCLSQRPEPFWRDNRRPESIPEGLACLLTAWKHRPPCRFDFVADYETFPYFSYQYVLYGMGFQTDLEPARARYSARADEARHAFTQLRRLAQQATADLPAHRTLLEGIRREGSGEKRA
jgi:tryptophan halogenase